MLSPALCSKSSQKVHYCVGSPWLTMTMHASLAHQPGCSLQSHASLAHQSGCSSQSASISVYIPDVTYFPIFPFFFFSPPNQSPADQRDVHTAVPCLHMACSAALQLLLAQTVFFLGVTHTFLIPTTKQPTVLRCDPDTNHDTNTSLNAQKCGMQA